MQLRSPVLIGLDCVLGHEWRRLSKLPQGCHSPGTAQEWELVLHKVTFGFETKAKEPFIERFMTQTDQLRKRERRGRGQGDIQIVPSA